MNNTDVHASIGDIIMSELFAFSDKKTDDGRFMVGFAYNDKEAGKYDDPERAQAKYVTEDVRWVTTSEEDVKCVTAIRLHDDGSFNPQGERISFFQCSDYVLPRIDSVEVVGKMQRVVSFVPIAPKAT